MLGESVCVTGVGGGGQEEDGIPPVEEGPSKEPLTASKKEVVV